MSTENEQLEAEIAERDSRIFDLEASVECLTELQTSVQIENDRLKAQQLSAGVACALMSALEGIVHDQRVPNEVSQECAAVLIEARRLNPSPQPRAGVVLPERKMFSEYDPHPEYPSGWNDCLDEVERLNPCRAQASGDSE